MNKLIKQIGLVIVLCAVLVIPASADSPTVKVTQIDASDFPEVKIYVSVTDEAGQPVAAYKQEDFDLREDGEPVKIVDFAGVGSDRPVDIVFVFDTTSSMAEEIEGVKDTSIEFANRLRDSNRDFRLGLIAFGDEIRSIDKSDGALTDDAEQFKGWVSRLSAVGGDDPPETSLDALQQATAMQFRAGTQKILLLITDAPPHTQGDGTSYSRIVPAELNQQLKDEGFTVYAVAYDDPIFRQIVSQTGGEFYDIYRDSNFIGIIDKIGGLIASQYSIVYESNRPAYDGTRRPVAVTVGGSTGETAYAEEHMLNVQSNPVVGAVLALLLLAALVLPVVTRRRKRAASVPPSAPAYPVSPTAGPTYPPPSAPAYPVSPTAGPTYPPPSAPAYPVSPTAGPAYPPAGPAQAPGVAPVSLPPTPLSPDTAPCTRCGQPVRIGAKFCTACGQPTSAAPAPAAPQPPPTASACPHCGQPLRPGAKFCAHCGTRFSTL